MPDLGITVSETTTAARVGLLVGAASTQKVISALAQAITAVGRAVSQGVADNQVTNPNAAGSVTETLTGIVRYRESMASDAIAIGDAVDVVRGGLVWVLTEDAVAAGQTAFIRIAADAGGPDGAARPVGGFRSDADGDEATECTRAVYRTSTTGIGLALVEINLP
jgi:hypothetical protein